MKKTLALASIALLAGSLTACGGGDSNSGSGGSYCDQVKSLKDTVNSLDFTALDDAGFSDFQDSLDGIEASAPSDIKGDWTTLNAAVDQLKGILADAGLTFDDLKAIQADPSNLPDGVDIAKLQALAQKLNDFAADSDFKTASDNIQANVKSECGIDISATSTTTGS
ncbi:MAG TPA: hypothetical protein VLK34_04065 [Nocardioidaceae bacterium]|nr:hypothetical protein [Nocardioidaceae bacterium]